MLKKNNKASDSSTNRISKLALLVPTVPQRASVCVHSHLRPGAASIGEPDEKRGETIWTEFISQF